MTRILIKIVKWIFYSAIVVFALMMIAAFMIGTEKGLEETEKGFDNSVSPIPESISTPAIPKIASQILPKCTEIGNGVGWTANYKINDARGTSEGHYYKDDRCVIINVSIMADKNGVMIRYYDLHEQWDRDEYSPLEYAGRSVGEMSMLRIYKCPSGYGYNCIESGNGCFVTDNIIVTVLVEDYHVTARDVGRYAGQIDI